MLFLACAFPFVGLPGSNFDVQPWALLAALLVLALAAATGRLAFHRDMAFLLAAAVLFVMVSALDLFGERTLRVFNVGNAARLLFGVGSLPIIASAVYVVRYRLEPKLLLAAYWVWLLTAFIQLRVRSFGASVLPRISTSAERGVVALAPEPDSYGRAVIAFVVMALVLYLANRLSRRTLVALVVGSLLQLLFLSRAATSSLFIVIVGGIILYVVSGRAVSRWAILLAFGAVVAVVVWAGLRLMADTRVFLLLRELGRDPSIVARQGGFILRTFNPLLSIQVGLFETLGRGVGVASTPVPGQVVSLWPLDFRMTLADRAHGGLVGLVYSAGAVGALYVVFYYHALIRALRRLGRVRGERVTLAGVAIYSIMVFFDQSLANGMHAYAFGMLLLLAREAPAPVPHAAPPPAPAPTPAPSLTPAARRA